MSNIKVHEFGDSTEDSLAKLVNRQIIKIRELTEQRDALLKIARIVSEYFPEFEENPDKQVAYIIDEFRTIIRKADEKP